MVVLNKGNLDKLDLLVGFVNAIVYKVSSTEEHLSPNCNGSSILEIGYYRDKNDCLHWSLVKRRQTSKGHWKRWKTCLTDFCLITMRQIGKN